MPYLQEIEKMQDYEDLAAYVTKSEYKFSDVLMMSPTSNPKDTSSYVLAVTSPSFFLNDTTDYEDLDNMSDYTQLTYDSGEDL